LRVSAILIAHYDVPEKSFTELFKKLGPEQSPYKQALEMIQRVSGQDQAPSKKI
jgi:hypothetical protein